MREDIGRNTTYWFNVTTGQVEEEGESKASDRLGPFPDRETASHALDIVRAREERKKAEDEEWSEG